jgi:hypothetical protein
MNDIITLLESAGQPTKVGNRWLVTIAKPGKGSTGTYTEEMLKATGPIAFPPGTKAFFNHDPKRDVRDMVGTYDEGAFWNDEIGELQAFLTPFPRYRTVLDEAGQNVEASIHASARKDHKTGYVKELLYNRSNTVDLVSFAGLEGSGLKYQVESLFAAAAAEVELNEKKENEVEEKIVLALETLVSKLETLSAKFDTFAVESKTEVQGVADEAAVETLVKTRVEEALDGYAEVEKSINDADIPAIVKESLKALARKGEDITETLEGAVSIVAETKKEFTPDPKNVRRDRVVVVDESTDSQPKNFRVGRWSK